MSSLWDWTRSTGIVASILAVGSIVWGLRFSARATGNRLRPNWWLDLHNWLGGLALAFTAAHVVFAVATTDEGLSWLDAILPGRARDLGRALDWGIIAFYVFALVVFTSWPKKRFARKIWRTIHVLSLPALLLVGLHTFQMGSDAPTVALRVLTVALVAVTLYPIGLRLMGLRDRRTRRGRDSDAARRGPDRSPR